ILGDMHAATLRALDRDAGPDHLAQPVDVQGNDVEPPLERVAHGVRPRLGAEETDPELEAAGPDAGLLDGLGEVERVGRRAAEHGAAEVRERRQLAVGEADRDGDDSSADALGAIVEPEPTGEEAIAIRVLDDVTRPDAAHHQGPRHHLAPEIEIAARVGDYG